MAQTTASAGTDACRCHFSDQALLDETVRLAGRERAATARLIAAIAEVDARRLSLGEGFASMFVYCTRALGLSEHAAYGRIEAARLARRLPVILTALEEGSIRLTTVCLLAPHLTAGNHAAVLAEAAHKSKREVEQLVAGLRPQPPVAPTIRRLPDPKPPVASSDAAALEPATAAGDPLTVNPPARVPPAVIKPLAPERYKVQFTVSAETYAKLRRAQDLLRHTVPNGDLAVVFDRALTLLLGDLEKKKLAAAARPRAGRPSTRVSSAVHQREQQRRAIGRQRHAVPPRLPQLDDPAPPAGCKLEKINRCLVWHLAHGQEVEAALRDDEIERIAQSVGNTLLCAPIDRHTPDRTR